MVDYMYERKSVNSTKEVEICVEGTEIIVLNTNILARKLAEYVAIQFPRRGPLHLFLRAVHGYRLS